MTSPHDAAAATTATARGLATITYNNTVLDVWYPAPKVDQAVSDPGTKRLENIPQQFEDLHGPDEGRGVARVAVNTSIESLAQAPTDAYDAYLRLHLLSHRLVRPNEINLDGLLDLLANVVWTNYGPCDIRDFQMVRGRLAGNGPVTVYSVDKVPRMVDYVVPSDVTIGDAGRVRLGAHLAAGTTVTHEGFVDYNAGSMSPTTIDARVFAGNTV